MRHYPRTGGEALYYFYGSMYHPKKLAFKNKRTLALLEELYISPQKLV